MLLELCEDNINKIKTAAQQGQIEQKYEYTPSWRNQSFSCAATGD